MPDERITFLSKKFWSLFGMKVFRNFASVKYQILILLYVPIIYGIFDGKWVETRWVSKISPAVGLGFLGGGYVTIALGRIYTRTKLTENGNGNDKEVLDTNR